MGVSGGVSANLRVSINQRAVIHYAETRQGQGQAQIQAYDKSKNTKEKHDYAKYIQSSEWKRKRAERLIIDKHTCQICGNQNWLNVHHLTYKRLGHERMSDLITLCQPCHEKIHERLKGEEKETLEAVLAYMAKQNGRAK